MSSFSDTVCIRDGFDRKISINYELRRMIVSVMHILRLLLLLEFACVIVVTMMLLSEAAALKGTSSDKNIDRP